MGTMDIRENLISIRESKGYSKRTVSEMTGIPYTTYIKYESGERKEVSMQALCKLADFYGVTTDYLLGREAPPEKPEQPYHKGLEDDIKEIYKQLPREVRAQILQAMIDAVMSYQTPDEPAQSAAAAPEGYIIEEIPVGMERVLRVEEELRRRREAPTEDAAG